MSNRVSWMCWPCYWGGSPHLLLTPPCIFTTSWGKRHSCTAVMIRCWWTLSRHGLPFDIALPVLGLHSYAIFNKTAFSFFLSMTLNIFLVLNFHFKFLKRHGYRVESKWRFGVVSVGFGINWLWFKSWQFYPLAL